MSRNPSVRSTAAQTDASSHDASFQMINQATALYGDNAPTAVAFCALEAWFEGNQDEYRFWLQIFLRLRN